MPRRLYQYLVETFGSWLSYNGLGSKFLCFTRRRDGFTLGVLTSYFSLYRNRDWHVQVAQGRWRAIQAR
jgi:hypothetical protein